MNNFHSQIFPNDSPKPLNNNNIYISNQQIGCIDYSSSLLPKNRPLSQKGEEKKSESTPSIPQKNKTLVLDLDETLIHSTPFPMSKVDVIKTVFLS